MIDDRLRERIRDQFSAQAAQADLWPVFDTVLDTQAFLNLGYSHWYQPVVFGSSQRRLARKLGSDLVASHPRTDGVRLLDIGCGRGGPAIYFADHLGFDVTGIDLVPYNVAVAKANATTHTVPVEFLVGDAVRLPFKANSFEVCTALDSICYVPEKRAVFAEMAAVLSEGGHVVLSDLVRRDGLSDAEARAVEDFAAVWDLAPITTLDEYRRAVEHAGLRIQTVQDISSHSVTRFRKWTALSLLLINERSDGVVRRLLQHHGHDIAVITEQIHRTHAALSHLRHVTIVARRD